MSGKSLWWDGAKHTVNIKNIYASFPFQGYSHRSIPSMHNLICLYWYGIQYCSVRWSLRCVCVCTMVRAPVFLHLYVVCGPWRACRYVHVMVHRHPHRKKSHTLTRMCARVHVTLWKEFVWVFIAAARLLHWVFGVHESSGTECKVVSAATDPRWQHIARSHSRPP